MNLPTDNALARALGALLSQQATPRVAVLPHDLPWDQIACVVNTANDARSEVAGGYSYLVHDSANAAEVPRISSAQATAYREGPRLLVVRGTGLAHASNEVFRPVLDASWPDPAHEKLRLRDVATVLADGLHQGEGGEILEAHILQALEVTRAIHLDSRSGGMQWNTAWWLHVTVALRSLAVRIEDIPPESIPEEVFPFAVRAAFGLPNLQVTGVKALEKAGGSIASGLAGPWSSADDATGSVKLLTAAREDLVTEWEGASFAGFDDKLHGNDSPGLAWVKFLAESPLVAAAVANLPLQFFVEPTGGSQQNLGVLDAHGVDLTWSKGLPAARTEIMDGVLRSEELILVLPTVGRTRDPLGTHVSVVVSPTRFSFVGSIVVQNGGLSARGRLEMKGTNAAEKFKPRAIRLSIDVPPGDVLEGVVAPRAGTSLLLVHPTQATFAHRGDSRGAVHTEVLDGDELGRDVELTGRKQNDLLLVPAGSRAVPAFNGEDWHASMAIPWRHERIEGSQDFRVELDDRSVDARRKQDARSARWSPLIALLDGSETYTEGEPQLGAHEVRGVVEQDLAELLGSGLWRPSLGHYVLSDSHDSSRGLVQAPATWARTESDLASPHAWANLITPPVPQELLLSSEVEAFRDAFDALRLQALASDEGRVGAAWPSLISYASLWNSDTLHDYLDAYAALQRKARAGGSGMGAFWAAYPFSVSVWKPGSPRAVLLSPWHPVRLAWLSAVSMGVASEANAELSRRFAGVVEGWNFPAVGPTETAGAAMLAVPAGNGHEQLFVGWATMVRASSDLNVLRMPHWVGGAKAPVTTMSGLNGTAVRKALRDFQRANAHVATLSIDLAMASDGPRLEEIDTGILDEVSQWIKDGRGQLGGLRVHDSSRRSGAIPVTQVQSLASSGVAVTWQRYDEEGAIFPNANIRVVQDAGQLVRTEQAAPGVASGAVAMIPYRRIETPGPVDPHNPSLIESRPLLIGKPRSAFEAALQAIESPPGASGLIVKSAFQSTVGSSPADWTVMGDSSLNPAAMARLVSQNPTDLALWEWCPPMLGSGSGETVLESRPYLSVARMPTSLKHQLDGLLSEWHEDVKVDPKDVLGTLGARGVGLASLIAIGGSHASGAMGFYVALRLLEQLSSSADLHLVLPMDACAEYLTALAISDQSQDDLRRADLLLVRINSNDVVLSPVEVKYYKPGPLPHAAHGDLREGLGQLGNSMAQLQRLQEAARKQDENSLWNAAFGALLEVGVRLSASAEGASNEAADLLRLASSGELSLKVGRPVLCFFKRASGGTRVERVRLDGFEHLQVVADPSLAMGWLNDDEARASLTKHLEWATHPDDDPVVEHVAAVLDAAEESDAPTAAELATSERLRTAGALLEASVVRNSGVPASAPDVVFRRDEGGSLIVPGSGAAEEAGQSPIPAPADSPASGALAFPGVRFPVGTLTDSVGDAAADFWPANTALTQLNVGVVGNLGTGKTQLLKAIVTQLRTVSAERQEAPVSILILDYKGDFTGSDFLEAVGGRVLKPHDIPVNYFDLDGPYSPMAAVRRAGSFNDVLSQIFNIGPKQQNALRKVVVERFKQHGIAPTIAEVLEDYVQNHSDSDSVVGVLEGWVMGEVFSEDRSEIAKFSDLMDGGVLVLDLLELGADQASKNALVALFLNLYYEYVVKLKKWPYEGQDPQLRRINSFLLVDEATNIMGYKFDALESLLLQGREFGVGVILSSQYLSHFKSTHIDYAQALRSWFVHSVPNVTSAQLAMLGLQNTDQAMASRITNLPTHHCLYSSLNHQGRFIRGTPFYELLAVDAGS